MRACSCLSSRDGVFSSRSRASGRGSGVTCWLSRRPSEMDRRHVRWAASSPDGGMKVRVRRRAGVGYGAGKWHGGHSGRVRAEGHPGSLGGASREEPGRGGDRRRLGRSGRGVEGRRGYTGLTSGLVWLGHPECPSGRGWSSRLALGINTSWRFGSYVPRGERTGGRAEGQENLACPRGGRRWERGPERE